MQKSQAVVVTRTWRCAAGAASRGRSSCHHHEVVVERLTPRGEERVQVLGLKGARGGAQWESETFSGRCVVGGQQVWCADLRWFIQPEHSSTAGSQAHRLTCVTPA